jgi:hypothetical protein
VAGSQQGFYQPPPEIPDIPGRINNYSNAHEYRATTKNNRLKSGAKVG